MAKKQSAGDAPASDESAEQEAAESTETAEAPAPREKAAPPKKDPGRGRQSAAPMCPYHPKRRCKAKGSTPFFTRYYCPEPGCTFSVKQPRPEMRTRLHEDEEDFSAR